MLPETTALTIPEAYAGQRLDAVLAILRPDCSRTHLSTALKQGQIQVDGHTCLPKFKVKGGENITLHLHAIAPTDMENAQPENIPLDVIYEDDALLVIHKPAGLVVHPGAGNREHTLVNALLFHCPDLSQLPRAGIIHRLDKCTTGLLLVAKTQAAYTFLTQQMRDRLIERHYLALVSGQLTLPYTLTTCYGRDPHHRVKMAVRTTGKTASTQYQPQQCFKHFTLLHLRLLTGRTHQIRVHLSHLKHPIVGDPLYGGPLPLGKLSSAPLKQALSVFPRQALHAYRLSFEHPDTHEMHSLTAPVPTDMQELIDLLETEDA